MKIKCELCGKKIKGPQGLAPHLRLAHGKPEVPSRLHMATAKLIALSRGSDLYREVARELENAAHALRALRRVAR